jgi:hypothetical protein
MVCSQADAECSIRGLAGECQLPSSTRKEHDGAAFEAAKYAERRDDIRRFMFKVLMQVRRCLEVDNKLK